jgi:two-component system, NarL family, response regulator NreC
VAARPRAPLRKRRGSPPAAVAAPRVRVILADDHPIVRAGLRHVLERGGGIEIAADSGDGRQLLRQVRTLHPDVVVVDVSMPEMNGVDAARIIHREHRSTRVVILSVHCTEAIVHDAIAAGAAGYVLKEAADEELRRAVLAVARGESYFSPPVARLLATRLVEQGRDRAMLSAREREVVQLISEGMRPQEIAAKLFVSIATVKTHRANAMRKLDARTTAELIRHAIRRGLTSV